MSRIRGSAIFPLALAGVIGTLVLSGFAFGGETVNELDVFAGEQTPKPAEIVLPATETIGVFDMPVEVIDRPGDDRNFVVEQGGRIVATNGAEQSVVLDIAHLTSADGERGLLGAAFHPELALLYVHYSDADGDSVLAEFTIDSATGQADVATFRVVMTVAQPYENHNGGEVVFGPDGFLYWGLGDGGLANDPERAALDLSSPLGKILRIDPTSTETSDYSVPEDNPFVGVDGANTAVWSFGLRNPWRFSFDSATGDLWIADVGQYSIEEINVATAQHGESAGRGLSFGWSAFEGTEEVNQDQLGGDHVDPLVTYTHENGSCSISGGAVYRGANPALDGWYIYGDYCTGEIWGFDTSVEESEREIQTLGQTEALVAVAQGASGEIFAVSHGGLVFQVS